MGGHFDQGGRGIEGENACVASLGTASKPKKSYSRLNEFMQRRITIALICIVQWAVMLVQAGMFSENPWTDRMRWIGLIGLSALALPARGSRARSISAADIFAGMFLLLALSSVWETPYQQTALLRTISAVLLYVAVFWSLWHFADQGGEKLILRCFAWCLGLCLLGGLLAAPTGLISAWQTDGRFRGIMPNPNSIGLLGAIAFPLLLTQALERRRWMDHVFVLAAAGSVLLSGSRTSAVSCAIATIFLLARAGMGRGLAILLVAGTLAGTLLAIRPWEKSESYAGTTLFDNPIARLSFKDDTLMGGGRFEVWPLAVDEIKESPLLGYGFGTEEFWMDEAGVSMEEFKIHQGKYMHNSYLGLTYQLGLVGAAMLFIPLFILAANRLLRLLQRKLTLEQAGYTGVLLVGLVACFSESWIYSVGNAFAFPFWTIVMLSIRRQMLDDRRKLSPFTSVGAEQPPRI